ncbi:hypothetical protein WAI453_002727 [Rhynchosporium graminicola]
MGLNRDCTSLSLSSTPPKVSRGSTKDLQHQATSRTVVNYIRLLVTITYYAFVHLILGFRRSFPVSRLLLGSMVEAINIVQSLHVTRTFHWVSSRRRDG